MISLYSQLPLLQQRRHIDTLLEDGGRLSAADKTLLRMVFKEGISLRRIAHLTGKNPSTTSRRFRRLLRRLLGRQFSLTAYDGKSSAHIDSLILREYLLRGRSQKTIARHCSTSLYRVRRTLRTIRSGNTRARAACVPPYHARHKKTHSHSRLNERSKPCTR